MKKIIVTTLIMLLLTGCSSTNNTTKNNSDNAQNEAKISSVTKDNITFADPIFEKYFRANISKLSGDLTLKDTSDIKQIQLGDRGFLVSYQSYKQNEHGNWNQTYKINSDDGKEVLHPNSVEDLKYFTNLEYIRIDPWRDDVWPVSSIDFISNMPNIKYAYIGGRPHYLTPLGSCDKLEYLAMDFSQVTDFSIFSKLNNVKFIYILNKDTADAKEEKKDIEENIKKYLKSDNVKFDHFD